MNLHVSSKLGTERICRVIREVTGAEVDRFIGCESFEAGIAELRLDYLHPDELSASNVTRWVRNCGCPVILTLRRKANGGEFVGSESEQIEVLKTLLDAGASFIDLEIETIEGYLQGTLTNLQNKGSLAWIASYHNFRETPKDLSEIHRRLLASKANVCKIATKANALSDNFLLMDLAKRAASNQTPLVVAAMGELGTITRILAPSSGSLWTYAAVCKGHESAEGQLTVEELTQLYDIGTIDGETDIYGVVGYPLGHTLSPAMHNAAFRDLGLNARYLPLAIKDIRELAASITKFVGLSVTIPHKTAVLDLANQLDDSVKVTGAANTLVRSAQGLTAFNTDLDGIRFALREPLLNERAQRVTLLGTGGAARAAAWVVAQPGNRVTVLARNEEKARVFAAEFGFEFGSLADAQRYDGDLLINATSVGMSPSSNESPVTQSALKYRYVFDMVYNPLETRLLREAKGRAVTISGLEMFVAQGARQFELWIGKPAPRELMRRTVMEKLCA